MPTREELITSRLIERIERVALRVTDIERSVGFYSGVVGLEVASSGDGKATLRAPGGEVIIELDSSGVTQRAQPLAAGLFHTAIRFPTRSALGDALARLVEAGFEIGAGDHLVSEALYIDDPDGNGVELYWDRPVAEWPPPRDGMMVPMATEPVDLHGLLESGEGRGAVGAPAPAKTDIGHVHLQVSDMAETLRFYGGTLGLDVTGSLGSAAFFSSNGYHHHFGTNTWRTRLPLSGPERAGLSGVTLRAEPEALENLARRFENDVDGSLVVHDPDGIRLEFAGLQSDS